jgi:uncharacterized membrane-anchored protein
MDASDERLIAGFDPTSLCYSLVERGNAAMSPICQMATADPHAGARPWLTPARTGALSQRLIDIEPIAPWLAGLPLALTCPAAPAASRTAGRPRWR